jgi:phosphatidylethanolamine/phosphatidyl-N-methylethanolamine N-methyltransferase
MKNEEKLHASLREFYNRSADYFNEAGEANAELTPERANLFQFIPENALLLDVGCGRCENAAFLKGRVRYVACDLTQLGINGALSLGRPIHAAVLAESQTLPFRDNSVDCVLSTYALEHLVFPEKSLREMWRVCRPQGRVLIISPTYDDPRFLPPSTSHWNPLQRASLIAAQTVRQCIRHFNSHRFYFTQITQPRVFRGEYQPDYDAVHLVSAREIANFFHSLGARFLFERKRTVRPAANIRDTWRNLLLRAGIGAYAGLNLQLAVEKP